MSWWNFIFRLLANARKPAGAISGPLTLEKLLEPCRYEDITIALMGLGEDKQYINPHLPIPFRDNVDLLVLHCTADEDRPCADVYDIAKYDVSPQCHINPDVGCPCITYHYYIEKVQNWCTVFKCLTPQVKAWHVGPHWNARALAVAIDYDSYSLLPKLYWDAAVKLMAWLCRELGLPVSRVKFHRELEHTGWSLNPTTGEKVYRKSCPGWQLNPDVFRQDVARKLNEIGL